MPSCTSRRMAIRAAAEDSKKTEAPTAETKAPEVETTVATPAVAVSDGISMYDAMTFSGAGPEIINGRLSMLGFIAALGAELSTGETVGQQFSEIPGAMFFVVCLLTSATLIPFMKKGTDRPAFGPFTPQAELANGRVAMLGFASLLIAEAVRGSALF